MKQAVSSRRSPPSTSSKPSVADAPRSITPVQSCSSTPSLTTPDGGGSMVTAKRQAGAWAAAGSTRRASARVETMAAAAPLSFRTWA